MKTLAAQAGRYVAHLQQESFCTTTAPQGIFGSNGAGNAEDDDALDAILGPASGGTAFTAIQYDFARPRLITSYLMKGLSTRQGGVFRTGTVTVARSNDGSAWTDINSHVCNPAANIDVAAQGVNAMARYLRVRLASFGTADSYVYLQFWDIAGLG